MPEWNLTGSRMFSHAAKFIDAYHNVLQPLCRETGLPPMAMDILLFVANNPDRNTASDICQCRGLKSGIVSVHVDRLVNEGLLVRAEAANDRRKTRLTCTEKAQSVVAEGRKLQKAFANKLSDGINESDMESFRRTLTRFGENLEDILRHGL